MTKLPPEYAATIAALDPVVKKMMLEAFTLLVETDAFSLKSQPVLTDQSTITIRRPQEFKTKA
jgi:hypothetical protein